MHGKDGDDLDIPLPIGSIVTNLSTEEVFTLQTEGQRVLVLNGGKGGLGNEHFKSSTNRSPKESTPGKAGEEAELYIELELVVDAGFIGLPNAGKSSLLNAVTRARAKVGNFAFTTLEPNLGDLYGYIIADIPGLIEGASEGKGLGHKFLRHIKKTEFLAHCVSLENENPREVYDIIRRELSEYSKDLLEKKELLVFTKKDLIDAETLKAKLEMFKDLNKPTFVISVYDEEGIKTFADELVKILRS